MVTSTGANVGIGTAPVYLVFAEDWFADGEVIVGELNEIYPIRILGEGRNEGTNTLYKVEVLFGNLNEVYPMRVLEEPRSEGTNFVVKVELN